MRDLKTNKALMFDARNWLNLVETGKRREKYYRKTKQKITNNKRIQNQTYSTTPSDFATTRENETRDRIPHT